MSDGNNDEFSAAGGRSGGMKRKYVYSLARTFIFMHCVISGECVRQKVKRGGREEVGRNKKREENERARGQNGVTT